MKEVDYTYAYAMALVQFNLMQIKQENELLKATAGATVPIPAYYLLKPPELDEYEKGWLDGWIACTEHFIKEDGNSDDQL